MPKVVKAGDSIRSAVTASWFNEQNKNRNVFGPSGKVFIPENPVKVDCVAATGVDLERFDAANIVGPAIPYEDLDGDAVQYSTAMVKVNATLVENKWGIVQGPCLPEQSSRLVVLGITWANFTYTADDTHVDVVGGALVSGTSGKAIILSPPEEAGKPGLILIRGGGGSSGCKLAITPSGGIAARAGTSVASATCNLIKIESNIFGSSTGSIVVYNPWPVAIPQNYYISAKIETETGFWIADFPGVLNVRWVSPNLEQTLDGGTYLNIDTAEECV